MPKADLSRLRPLDGTPLPGERAAAAVTDTAVKPHDSYGHGRDNLGDIVPDAPPAPPTTADPKTQRSPGSATAVPRERKVYALAIEAFRSRP